MPRTLALPLALVVSMIAAQCARPEPPAPPVGSAPGAVTFVKASNPGEDDHLGHGDPLMGLTVALSRDGSTLVAAAPHEDSGSAGTNGNQADESASDSGAVYVYARTGASWSQQAYVKASNPDGWDLFGFSVAVSADGNTMAVSAPWEDSAARGIGGDQRDNSAEQAGAVYVFVRQNGAWMQQAYIKASNTDAGDQFGFSLALSDDGATLAVGALGEGSSATGINGDQSLNAGLEFGAAYVFTRNGSDWTQQAYIKASNAEAADRFGFCLALSRDGNTLGVCGYDEDGSSRGVNGNQADNGATGSGAAYVFVREGGVWRQEAYLKASNTTATDAFGTSIAISADGLTLAVCAGDEDVLVPGIDGSQEHTANNEQSAGAVYVFTKTNGTWAHQAYIKSSNIRPSDTFGVRLALSADGSVLAAGAPLQPGAGQGLNPASTDFTVRESGAVYLFRRSEGKWAQYAYLKAPNAEAYDQFGGGVALSGDARLLAVGAPGESSGSRGVGGNQADNSVRASGAVYLFE